MAKTISKYLFISAFLLLALEYLIDIIWGDGDGQITLPVLDSLFKIVALIVVLLFSNELLRKALLSRYYSNLIKLEPNIKLLGITRILFGLVCFFMAIQNFDLLEILYFDKGENFVLFVKFLNFVWCIAAILIVLGVGLNYPFIICALLVPILLHADVGRHQLFITSFWMIFMKLDRQYSFSSVFHKNDIKRTVHFSNNALPLFLLGLHLSINICMAGVSKSLDVIWIDGNGFYYTFLNDWLKHYTTFDFIAENQLVMSVMNYATVASELITLPLFIIPRTRKFAVFLIFAMYLQLTIIFRIDAIGPSGLVIATAMLSLLFSKVNDLPSTVKPNPIINASIVLLMSLLFFITTSEIYAGRLKYPRVSWPFSLTEPHSTVDFPILKRIGSVQDWNRKVFWNYSLFPYWYEPFNMHHFFGRYQFKIVLTTFKNETKEPIKVFKENGLTDYYGISGGILKPRVLQDKITHFQYLGNRFSFYENEQIELDYTSKLLIKRLASLKDSENDNLKFMDLLVRPYYMPFEFQGNKKPWLNNEWTSLIRYDYAIEDSYFVNRIKNLEFDNINNPWFLNKQIIFKP